MEKDIRGYEGRYYINEFGEVFSRDREIIDGKREVIHKLSETTLSDIQFAHFVETKEIVRLREIND